MKKTIAIIGCGNLGSAIAKGILEKSSDKYNVIATRNKVELLTPLQALGVEVSNNNIDAVAKSEIILLAVKPYLVATILNEIKNVLNPAKVLVSLATGITIADMKLILGDTIPVLRAMPNTATGVGESLTCLCSSDSNSEKRIGEGKNL